MATKTIHIDLDVLNAVKIASAEDITINGHQAHRTGGWSLGQIIYYAASHPGAGDPLVHNEEPGVEVSSWHDGIYLDSFKENGNDFDLFFGS